MIRAFVVVLSVALAHPAWAGDDAPGVCGDSVVQPGEQCDEGGDTPTCNANCTVPVCGDGYLNLTTGEQCDDGPTGSLDCTPSCTASVCGDGYVNVIAGEQCDGGPACDAWCQVTSCGNGVVDAGEDCDDGNHATGDGCSATCHVEAGYTCVDAAGLPAACRTTCGDGIIAGSEACDDGNTRDGDGCSAACDIEVGWTCNGAACVAICGDGIQVAGEACDDGNSQTGDGCTPACTLELGWTSSGGSSATTCGDGIVAGAEQCDDGNRRSGDGCSASCTIETAPECATAACGMSEFGTDMMNDATDAPTELARTAGCNATGTDGSVLLVLGALVTARRRKRC
jgi:uncharacterized protein (TIGR03382 family)